MLFLVRTGPVDGPFWAGVLADHNAPQILRELTRGASVVTSRSEADVAFRWATSQPGWDHARPAVALDDAVTRRLTGIGPGPAFTAGPVPGPVHRSRGRRGSTIRRFPRR